jgi:integrase
VDERSEIDVVGAQERPKRVEQRDNRVPGLRLRIGARRSTWVLICRLHGRRPSRHTLGHFPIMTRAQARSRALEIKAAIASGRDPLLRPVRGAQTFGDVCQSFFKDIDRRKLRAARETERDTRRDLARFFHRPIDRLERADVLHLVRDILDKRGASAARHAFSYLSRVLNWSLEQGIIQHSPVQGLKPARLIGPKPARERILDEAELRALWIAAGKLGTAGVYVKTLLLTAQRRREVSDMRWSEINGALWVIPSSRNKSGREHAVPIVPAVRELLDSLPRNSEFVFSYGGRGPIRNFGLIRKRLPPGDWTLHDLRRTARSSMSALGVRIEVAEKVLNHSLGSLIGVYDRHTYASEKLAALEAWAERLMRILSL